MKVCVKRDDELSLLARGVQDCGVSCSGEADIGDVPDFNAAFSQQCGCAPRHALVEQQANHPLPSIRT